MHWSLKWPPVQKDNTQTMETKSDQIAIQIGTIVQWSVCDPMNLMKFKLELNLMKFFCICSHILTVDFKKCHVYISDGSLSS